MLLLGDRNFLSWNLWAQLAATGADLCIRASASFKAHPDQVLADGTYLARLAPPRKSDGDPITVRVVEYSITTTIGLTFGVASWCSPYETPSDAELPRG